MKLEISILSYQKIIQDLNLNWPSGIFNEYLAAGRDDILTNIDIFCENIRSRNRTEKNFDIFQHTETITSKTVIILGLYLELFLYLGYPQLIPYVCEFYSKKYPSNKIVGFWNHDLDAHTVFSSFINKYSNIFIINYNTSHDYKNFINIPFWTFNSEYLENDKKYFCNLVTSINHSMRLQLKNTLTNEDGFFISTDWIEPTEYRNILSSSKFTLCPRGQGLSSYRFFECIHLNTIPVLIADEVILPYQDLDYSEFIVRIPENKIADKKYILDALTNVDFEQKLAKIKEVRPRFTLSGIQKEIYKRLI